MLNDTIIPWFNRRKIASFHLVAKKSVLVQLRYLIPDGHAGLQRRMYAAMRHDVVLQ
jgi:hypothetical protein